MMMRFFGPFLIIALLLQTDFAYARSVFTLGADTGFGKSVVNITNPSGSQAVYTGYIGKVGALLKIGESDRFFWNLHVNYRFVDLANTSNSSSQKEYAFQSGPGIGTSFGFKYFFLAGHYYMLGERHSTVGIVSHDSSYKFNVLTYEAGLRVPVSYNSSVMLSYSAGESSIPKDQTQLSKDSKYTESIGWLTFTLTFGSRN